MKLIVGLGNPGKEYVETRHNAGFMFLDSLQKSWGFPEFSGEKKLGAELSLGTKDEIRTILAKPSRFMNRSGDPVAAIVNFYKLLPNDIVVVHDDLDIRFGFWKEAFDSGAAGHNGVGDIIEKLGTKEFRRIRIGIGRPPENRDPADYVLDRFTAEERDEMIKTIEKIIGSFTV